MNRIRNYQIILLFLIVAITSFDIACAQAKSKTDQVSKEALIKNLVDSQNFVFVPQTISPMRGSTRQLTSYYDLTISKDSLVSYLPYFGRAYVAPVDPTRSSLDFTSTNFDYIKTANKKKGWDVLIKPKDQTDIRQLSFHIFDNGSASLIIASLNREPITFQGYIREKQKK